MAVISSVGDSAVAAPSAVSSATITSQSQSSSSPQPGRPTAASSSPMSQPSPSIQLGSTPAPTTAASAADSSSPTSQSSPSLGLGPAELNSESSNSENISKSADRIQAPPLWSMYMVGHGDAYEGNQERANAWFNRGYHSGPGYAKDPKNHDLIGRMMEIIAEYHFLRQTRGDPPIRPEDATPLDRRRKPRPDLIAQCFVASVGLHDESVRRSYWDLITARRFLTDSHALSSRGERAQHSKVRDPWLTSQRITLTILTAQRMSETGVRIRDEDTPSYPIGRYSELDAFRRRLRVIFDGEEESPPPAPKRAKFAEGHQSDSELSSSGSGEENVMQQPQSSAHASNMFPRAPSVTFAARSHRRDCHRGAGGSEVLIIHPSRGNESRAVGPPFAMEQAWVLRTSPMAGYAFPHMNAPVGPYSSSDMDEIGPFNYSITPSQLPLLTCGPSYPVHNSNPSRPSFLYSQSPYVQPQPVLSHPAASYSQPPQVLFASPPSQRFQGHQQMRLIERSRGS